MDHKEYIREVENADVAILMIHGILGTPRHFDRFLSLIPKEWSVYNILLHGHGKTVSDFAASSMEKWKKQVDEIAEKLCSKYKHVIIMGHSMGTLLAIRTAVKYPDKIKNMILLAVPMKVFVKPLKNLGSVKLALGFGKRNSELMEVVQSTHGTAPDKRVWKYLGYIPRFLELFGLIGETRKLLPELKTKSYVFQSREDELVAYSSKRYLENHDYIVYDELINSRHYYYDNEDMDRLIKRIGEILSC